MEEWKGGRMDGWHCLGETWRAPVPRRRRRNPIRTTAARDRSPPGADRTPFLG
jgi:hypothetical protein